MNEIPQKEKKIMNKREHSCKVEQAIYFHKLGCILDKKKK